MFEGLTVDQTRNRCRGAIESLEFWLRRIIHQVLSKEYGDEYFQYKDSAGKFLMPKGIRENVKKRMDSEPERYKREIDATQLQDAIDIICEQTRYEKHFGAVFHSMFPEGREELRTFADRLVEPRHRLSHANPITTRQAEQIICYSQDIIDAIKEYYKSNNMQEAFNVPKIIQFRDSFGNVVDREMFGILGSISFKEDQKCFLRPGDTLSMEVLVDPSFKEDEYTVEWWHSEAAIGQILSTKRFDLKIGVEHVREMFSITCEVKSNKPWHAHGHYDDTVTARYKVLPPVE